MAARNESLAETEKRSIAIPPAGVVWMFVLGGLAAFLGWMAVTVLDVRDRQIRLEEGQKRIEDGQKRIEGRLDRIENGVDEILWFLMRREQ